jgi:hypothetical protein
MVMSQPLREFRHVQIDDRYSTSSDRPAVGLWLKTLWRVGLEALVRMLRQSRQ